METIAALQGEVERVASELARAERELEEVAVEQRRRKDLEVKQRIKEEKLIKEKEEAQARVEALRAEAGAMQTALEDLKTQDQLLDLKLNRLSNTLVHLLDQRIADSKVYLEGLGKATGHGCAPPHSRSTDARQSCAPNSRPNLMDISVHDAEALGPLGATGGASPSSPRGAPPYRCTDSSSSRSSSGRSRGVGIGGEGENTASNTPRTYSSSTWMDTFEYATPDGLACFPESVNDNTVVVEHHVVTHSTQYFVNVGSGLGSGLLPADTSATPPPAGQQLYADHQNYLRGGGPVLPWYVQSRKRRRAPAESTGLVTASTLTRQTTNHVLAECSDPIEDID